MKYNLVKQDGWEYRTEDGKLQDKILKFEYCSLGDYKGKTFMSVNSESQTEDGYKCVTEEYLLMVTEMESYKKPRVLGNGYVTIPTSVEVAEKHYDRIEVFFNTARETFFGGDWDEDASYPGYTYNDTWNGWECPYFTREVCDAIMNNCFDKTSETTWESECDGYKYWYDAATDSYMEQMPDEKPYPLGKSYNVNGVHVYDLGAGNWCWCEEKEREE